MKTVWKYHIRLGDLVTIRLPEGAQILRVDMQGAPGTDALCLWALVNPDAPQVHRTLRIAGTGHDIEDRHAQHYLGTFFLDGGALVFHVFEVFA